MAALPRQFPDLALHLADQTRTPILSTASLLGGVDGGDADEHRRPTRQQRAEALDELAATALLARDTAARLGLGSAAGTCSSDPTDDGNLDMLAAAVAMMTPPEHMVVTYSTGAVMIENFLDPRQPRSPEPQRQQPILRHVSTATKDRDPQGRKTGDRLTGEDEEGNATGDAPLLLGLVIAPEVQCIGDARRATTRLERVGRAVQQELVAEGRRKR